MSIVSLQYKTLLLVALAATTPVMSNPMPMPDHGGAHGANPGSVQATGVAGAEKLHDHANCHSSVSDTSNTVKHTLVKRGLLDGLMPPAPGAYQQQPSAAGPGGPQDFLANFANQAQQALATQQLLQSAQSLLSGAGGAQAMAAPQQAVQTAQTASARALEGAHTRMEHVLDRATQTAHAGQTGIRAALTELHQGLQRLTQTNPNLVPEVRSIYQRVSSTLSSPSAPTDPNNPLNITPAKNSEQLADNLGKVIGIQPAQPKPIYPNLFGSGI